MAGSHEVRGSIPLGSTTDSRGARRRRRAPLFLAHGAEGGPGSRGAGAGRRPFRLIGLNLNLPRSHWRLLRRPRAAFAIRPIGPLELGRAPPRCARGCRARPRRACRRTACADRPPKLDRRATPPFFRSAPCVAEAGLCARFPAHAQLAITLPPAAGSSKMRLPLLRSKPMCAPASAEMAETLADSAACPRRRSNARQGRKPCPRPAIAGADTAGWPSRARRARSGAEHAASGRGAGRGAPVELAEMRRRERWAPVCEDGCFCGGANAPISRPSPPGCGAASTTGGGKAPAVTIARAGETRAARPKSPARRNYSARIRTFP